MKTEHPYIYFFNPKTRTPYYLVRFRNNSCQYIQSAFGNKNSPEEALARAIKYRDETLPANRKLHSRNLLTKPLSNKKNKLPAGITLSSYTVKRKTKFYTYRYLYITAGLSNKRAIYKRVYINKSRSFKEALKLAKIYRQQLAAAHNKAFKQK